ncbi:class I SAM-dependent methyltransferase [Salinarimonas sp.]|uniref:class I SAM-dependent methyltransferase n=1 Tax=Salinarimonas sp. TaxID=2766526 RepID=UPI0032D8F163
MNRPGWHRDDLRQVGHDFEDETTVAVYDARQGTTDEASRALATALGVGPGVRVIELGPGTGAFAVAAAETGAEVDAVDVSAAMLRALAARADAAGVRIARHRAGFLTYEHAGPPADLIVTRYAFHHLPDFWKGVALLRLRAMLRPGGRLYLKDVVFSFPLERYEEGIEGWIDRMTSGGDGWSRDDFETHVAEEHSTFDWILEGLFARSGFAVIEKTRSDDTYCAYLLERAG